MKCSFVLGLLALLFLPMAVHAQLSDVSCDDSDRLRYTLKTTIGAERRGMGLRGPETLVEIWIDRRSGDWLIVQNYSNGTSCIVAMGFDWEDLVPPGPA